MDSISSKIQAKINSRAKSGWVFSPDDFSSIGNRAVIDQTLSRLAKAGAIRRLARGLYDIPKLNPLLGKFAPPDRDQIIQAIARRDGIRVVKDNIVHANGLGFTNAVPAKLVYLTDGPSKMLCVGGWDLRLKHVSPAFMKNATSKSGPVFQALMWLGKDVACATPDLISKIRSLVSPTVAEDINKRVANFPLWMRPVLKDGITTKKRK